MAQRLVGVLTLALLLVGLFAVPAAGVEGVDEEHAEPPPSLEEIRALSPIAAEEVPQPTEPPSWTQWLYYPLIVVGVLISALLLFRYLQWQPRFAEERRSRRRR